MCAQRSEKPHHIEQFGWCSKSKSLRIFRTLRLLAQESTSEAHAKETLSNEESHFSRNQNAQIRNGYVPVLLRFDFVLFADTFFAEAICVPVNPRPPSTHTPVPTSTPYLIPILFLLLLDTATLNIFSAEFKADANKIITKPSTNPFLNVSPVHLTPNITNPFHVSLSQPLIDLDTAITTSASLNNNYKNDQNGNETNATDTKPIADNGSRHTGAPISLPTNPFNVTIDTVDNDNNENQINEKIQINNHRNVNDNAAERKALEEKCKNKRNTQVNCPERICLNTLDPTRAEWVDLKFPSLRYPVECLCRLL